MHQSKHDLLAKLNPAIRATLHEEAAAVGLSVDDLVHIIIGRPIGAAVDRLAYANIEAAVTRVTGAYRLEVEALKMVWPVTCAFCRATVDVGAEGTCVACGAVGCASCVTGRGCPPCVQLARTRIAKKREELTRS